MIIVELLYQLIISPITLMLQGVYSFSFHFLQSCGASIFPLSLVVNLLLLPFYRRADAIQKEERDRQKAMEPFVSHIKKNFKGDERYMMLQTYYRQNNYKPVYALRSSVALLLEIPFFIAAFYFLSNLQDMKFSGFGVLNNLASPDALISVGNIHINVLPVLMTLINVLSSEIYAKGMKFKEKLQLHGMALIFLVLLYNSPSGLVLYWTLNNVFSLVKNIVNNSKDKKRTASVAFSVLGGLILIYSFFFDGDPLSRLMIIAVGILFQIPLLFMRSEKRTVKSGEVKKSDNTLFITGAVYLSVLLGILIPSAVIASSPAEFILRTSVHSPVRYIVFSFLTALGAFVLWGGLFYYLADQKNRKRSAAFIWILAVAGTVDYFVFGKSDSLLSSDLKFDTGLLFSSVAKYLNLGIVVLLAGIMCFVIIKHDKLVRFMAPVLIAGVTLISGYNIFKISSQMPDIRRLIENSSSETPEISFSKDGKNVVVFMLDRSISSYIPYLFQERPVLEEQFSGFTYYPNTLSFGTRTVVAAPALFGGYDYTPDKINGRSDEMLRTKYDEALLTMPVLFSEAGYDVTVLDPPFAGFSEIPDLSIYDPYPGIKAYNTETGYFRDSDETDQALMQTWKRNFFCFSLMKISPLILQPVIYTDGTYFEPIYSDINMNNAKDTPGKFTVSSAYMNYFRDSYLAIKALPSMTEISGTSEEGSFILIQNGTAHNTLPLKEPEYEPAFEFDNTEYDETHKDRFTCDGKTIRMDDNYQLAHYQCNMAAFIQIGNWLDYLKEIGVYDNTRIIIVSDHGWPLGQRDDMILFDGVSDTMYNAEDAMAYNPVLLYKDFGSDEPFTTDYSFMTNADTPYLAMDGLLDDPVNPFISRPVFQPDAKYVEKLYIMYTDNWSLEGNTDNVFTDTLWYSLSGQNVFDRNNWHEETGP
ncbi:MAG: YidC/Oxa1 family membrane protein insertase [Clostridiales bacterium]|nr:YidC/Oxa1 family membrane protein insertase [Clostridiales bacterium]